MTTRVVIVESPTKAKTISNFLDKSYVVESSYGHVRDLPSNSKEIPAAYRSEPWARLGIDVENDFKPLYVISGSSGKRVRELRQIVQKADELYLATDEDREGEAISWHLLEVLSPPPSVKIYRMVFHEITREAITNSFKCLRDIDRRLVDAQEARRLLDRLYGFEVSPVLWKKVSSGLSAGRVQSVATRIVVERERERIAFVPASYWSLQMTVSVDALAGDTPEEAREAGAFNAQLTWLDGATIAQGRHFGPDGKLSTPDARVLSEVEATRLGQMLDSASAEVTSAKQKSYRRQPPPPFTTSTLQQEASRRLGMSPDAVMQRAQSLYEKGYITYMRTDSVNIASSAISAARNAIAETFGKEFLTPSPRRHRSRSRNAQEAHEAIRPAGERFRSPSEVKASLNPLEAQLYEHIWRRTLASQMTDTLGKTLSVELTARTDSGSEATFSASGTVITHEGFRRVLPPETKKLSDSGATSVAAEEVLPAVSEGESVRLGSPLPSGHETKPPPRLTEATLVRQLEELGVGRPSTYASITSTIRKRGYVWKRGSALIPAFNAFIVVGLLERHFADLVDYAFTARMEDDLDAIANGTNEHIPWLKEFYFGNDGKPGLRVMVSDQLDAIDARDINSIVVGKNSAGESVEVRLGRYGPYISCGSLTRSLPDDLALDELTVKRAMEILENRPNIRELGVDEPTGLPITVRTGRYGPFVQLGPSPGDEEGKPPKEEGKPRYASLFKSMLPEELTLEQALQLLSLPRELGKNPEGQVVTAQNGRYGPFVRCGKETRPLESEEQIFSVTLQEALELLAAPRGNRRTQRHNTPLRELGTDPETGKSVSLLSGRYGPYVTDGEVNASLGKDDKPEAVTLERACALLDKRRNAKLANQRSGGNARSRSSSRRSG